MDWYRTAKHEKDKKPYKIFLITPGESKQIGEVSAHSEAQARRFFLEQDRNDYAAYLEMGYTIKAVLDQEEFDRLEYLRRYREEQEEERVQDAWWNKY